MHPVLPRLSFTETCVEIWRYLLAPFQLPVLGFSWFFKGCNGHKKPRLENAGTDQIRNPQKREVEKRPTTSANVVPNYMTRPVLFPAPQNHLHSRDTNRRRWKLRCVIHNSEVESVSYSGDTTPCRMTGGTSHHHVLYKEILARTWCPPK